MIDIVRIINKEIRTIPVEYHTAGTHDAAMRIFFGKEI